VKAGILDRRVTLMRRTETQSPSGEPIVAWQALAGNRWASIGPVSGTERWATPQVAAQEQIEIRIRWSSDIADLSPRDRVVYPALDLDDPPDEIADTHIYDILALPEIGRREGFRIIATRRTDTQ
jgi:SPP1 family predicted phage head-tail adaptor